MTTTDDVNPRGPGPGRGEAWALGSLGLILLITAGWWALALWPVAGETPAWLARTRAVCFNATETGLPDASGWMLLIGQPLGMVGVLAAVWPRKLAGGLAALGRSGWGRGILGTTGVLLLAGLFGTAARVVDAQDRIAVRLARAEVPVSEFPRLDRPVPTLGLVDQEGRLVEPSDLRGEPTLVTFAFGHCETVCPLVVKNALEARRRLAGEEGGIRARVVVVTLDPWRDTPSRLPHLAEQWGLAEGDRVLSGPVPEVEAVLDAWNVPRSRDTRTGDIAHPALVYLVDAGGRIAFASRGDLATLVGLGRRL